MKNSETQRQLLWGGAGLLVVISALFLVTSGFDSSTALFLRSLGKPVTEVDYITREVLAEYPDAKLVDTTENSLTFHLGGRRYKLISSVGRFFTEDGQEIDTTLERLWFGDWIARTTSGLDYALYFAADGSRKYLPDTDTPSEYIVFGAPEYLKDGSWKTLPLGKAEIEDNHIFWETDEYTLQHSATPYGEKFEFIIKDESYNYPIRWRTNFENLTLQGDELISSSTGEPVVAIVKPIWNDSAEGSDSKEGTVDYSIENGYTQIDMPDLTGAVFPVTIDPTYAPAAGADDGYDSLSAFNNGNTYVLTGEDNNTSYEYNTWIRFPNFTIPQGATIESATIALVTSANGFGSGTVETNIRAIAADTYVAPTSHSAWVSEHANHTSASVTWDFGLIDNWGTGMTTPDISAVVEEVVGRSGWVSGNALGIHIDEDIAANVDRTQGWASWNSSSYTEPRLTVTYSTRRIILYID